MSGFKSSFNIGFGSQTNSPSVGGDQFLDSAVGHIHAKQGGTPNIIVKDKNGNIIGMFKPDQVMEAQAAVSRNPGSCISH